MSDDIVFVADDDKTCKTKPKGSRKSGSAVDILFGVSRKRKKATDSKTPSKIKHKASKKTKKEEDKSLKDDEPDYGDDSEQVCCQRYRVFGPNGIPEKCDVVGVDIGTRHLAMTGLVEDPSNPDEPLVACSALYDSGKKAVHFCCDEMDNLLNNDPNFKWFLDSDHHGIEQQGQVNPKARIVAGAIRSSIRTYKFCNEQEPDVSFVNAYGLFINRASQYDSAKYNLIHQYTDDPNWISQDISTLSGSKNKVVGCCLVNGVRQKENYWVKYTLGIWKVRGDKTFSRWFRASDSWTEQKHDISDSYLIALRYNDTTCNMSRKWKEIRGIAPKLVRTKKNDDE